MSFLVQTVGGGDGMLLNQHRCQELCAAAAWRCWAWSLQTTSLYVQRLVTSSAQTNYALCVALPRTEQCGSSLRLSRYRRRSSDVRRQRVAQFHQGVWSPALSNSARPFLTVCLSVCLSDRPSRSSIVSRRMKIRSCGFQHLVGQSF